MEWGRILYGLLMIINEVDDFGFTETGFGSKLYGES
jgi:hypothetical protein